MLENDDSNKSQSKTDPSSNVTADSSLDEPVNNAKSSGQTPKPTPKRYKRTRSYDENFFGSTGSGGGANRSSNGGGNVRSGQSASQHPHQRFSYAMPSTLTPESIGFNPYRRPVLDAYGGYYGSQPSFIYAAPASLLDLGLYGADPASAAAAAAAAAANGVDQLPKYIDPYRSTPMLNYVAANSYYGWHRFQQQQQQQQQQQATVTLPRHQRHQYQRNSRRNNDDGRKPAAGSSSSNAVNPSQSDSTVSTSSPETVNTDSLFFEKDVVGPFFAVPTIGQDRRTRRKRCSISSSSFCGGGGGGGGDDSDNNSGVGFLSGNRAKMCIVATILVIIVAVLVAMAIAVYSQVKSHNSGVKLVRQFRTSFVITGGRQLDYDADLLNVASQSFKQRARLFERKLDSLLKSGALANVFEGTEVTGFRFVTDPPSGGMEVQFNFKTKLNSSLQINDVLLVMDDAIRNSQSTFADAIIDVDSITVESKRLSMADG